VLKTFNCKSWEDEKGEAQNDAFVCFLTKYSEAQFLCNTITLQAICVQEISDNLKRAHGIEMEIQPMACSRIADCFEGLGLGEDLCCWVLNNIIASTLPHW
jgi:hypothetical protein